MYLKYVCIFCCLCLLPIACKQKQSAHLPKQKMEQVLLDIQLAEVYSTMAKKDSAQTQGLKNNDSLALYYKEVFTHHKISANQFIESLDWYRANPEELDTVYRRALNALDVAERKR